MSSLLRRAEPRVVELGDGDRDELYRLADGDPVVNAVVAARLRTLRTLAPGAFGGLVLGARDADGRLTGAAFSGGNLLPIGGGPADWRALAGHARDRGRACSSIVGRVAAVQGMWDVLAPAWGPARAIRAAQPLLARSGAAGLPAGDPRVRTVAPAELDRYLPAAAAMFTEELGVSPYEGCTAAGYRRRLAGLIGERRAFAMVDGDGEVAFKADVGAVSERTCQVQGVWVRPDLRGRGIGTAALAVVLRHALTLAPSVSLYVNDFNVAALRVYERLGMRQVATLSTVLF